MEEHIRFTSYAVVALPLCAMFIIVLLCAQRAIRAMDIFGNTAGSVVAVCVAMLSIVGLVRFFGSPEQPMHSGTEPASRRGLLDLILLPYVVLAIAMVLVLLLSAVDKLRHSKESYHFYEGLDKPGVADKSLAREGDSRRKEIKRFESRKTGPIMSCKKMPR